MTAAAAFPILLLPGWLNSGPSHWQSRWESLHGYTRVEQHDWQRPLRGDWIARLEDVLLSKTELLRQYTQGLSANTTPKAPAGVVLVAHSLGCHLVAAWAAASRNTHAVKAALLVAPPDVTREDFPPEMANWRRPVLDKLPFPSICILSGNDPFGSLAAGNALADAWGAQSVYGGEHGHLNGDSGLGDWPEGHAQLQRLLETLSPITA